MSESENDSKESLLQGAKELIHKTQEILGTVENLVEHPESLLDKAKQIMTRPVEQETEQEEISSTVKHYT